MAVQTAPLGFFTLSSWLTVDVLGLHLGLATGNKKDVMFIPVRPSCKMVYHLRLQSLNDDKNKPKQRRSCA